MLYQKLLVGENPYMIAVGDAFCYRLHRHREIELSYCRSGQYTILIDNRECCLHAGDLMVVNPMAAHEYPEDGSASACRMTIVVGPSLLGEFFESFVSMSPNSSVFHLQDEKDVNTSYAQLICLLEETAGLHLNRTEFSGLEIKGNLYKISALVLQLLSRANALTLPTQSVRDVEKIERALEIIYDRYSESLDLDMVSQVCGYSKSNFCKIFKRVTGDTFHNVLTRHRVEIACLHLKESTSTIDSIATMVGFSDAKSFCRTFKRMTGERPGTYRKESVNSKK